MSLQAPATLHLDLYRYWDAKRTGRAMPARRDVEPAELRTLLPFITLIDQVDGRLRYRLVGTAAAQEIGRDLTGRFVGSYVSPPDYAQAFVGICQRVITSGRPVFSTAEYRAPSTVVHGASRLMLPLGEDGTKAEMIIFTRISRFARRANMDPDWLQGMHGRVCQVTELSSLQEVADHTAEWQRQCDMDGIGGMPKAAAAP